MKENNMRNIYLQRVLYATSQKDYDANRLVRRL